MSQTILDTSIELDPAQLRGLEQALDPKQYRQAVENLQMDATLIGDKAAKEATPVVTGHARRSTAADTTRFVVEGRYPYLNWLDEGTDSRGRQMRTRSGGYQIRAAARRAVDAELPRLYDKAGREIVEVWVA